MLIIEELKNFEAEWEACALTLGVFDGVHRGHQALLKELQKYGYEKKKEKSYARVLLSYHPHPDLVLGKGPPEKRLELYTREEKLSLLQRLGADFDLDALCLLRFDSKLASVTALDYLKGVLLEKLRADYIVIGYDQRFGRGREGDYAFLKRRAPQYKFQVKQIPALEDHGEVISSSKIRQYISSGQIERANALLGYPFFIQAKVKRGEERGQKLGFPTANLELPSGKVLPGEGVYAGFADWKGERFQAMISIGKKPSFRSELELAQGREGGIEVEAHLLDFDEKQKLYGEDISLFFQKYLREQISFDSSDALIKQLERDKELLRK